MAGLLLIGFCLTDILITKLIPKKVIVKMIHRMCGE